MARPALKLKALHRLKTDAEAKAYLHPVRSRIVALLAKGSDTVSGVARALKTHPANITHHFRTLEENGLIRLVEERSVGHNVEKLYAPTALRFDITPPPGALKDANSQVLAFLREDLEAGIGGLAGDDSESVIGLISNVRIARKDVKRFAKKLMDLHAEFAAARVDHGIPYSLNVSIYPNARDYGPLGRFKVKKGRK